MDPQPVTSVFFDWDGTLCDSGPASLRAFRKSLGDFGVTFTDDQYKKVYTPRWYRMYEALGLPNSCWRAADERWLVHYQQEEPGLVPGASQVLDWLRAHSVEIGVVTNGTRRRVERELNRLGLAGAFRAVVCCEDVVERKPHPEGLHKALHLAGCGEKPSCYVGDTAEDVRMGKNAGVFTVGVLTEYVDRAGLEACAPDVLLETIADLPAHLTPA